MTSPDSEWLGQTDGLWEHQGPQRNVLCCCREAEALVGLISESSHPSSASLLCCSVLGVHGAGNTV